MKIIICLILALSLSHNNIANEKDKRPPFIEAIILAYDAMYTGDKEEYKDFIILDMESVYFVDTTYEERGKAINYFKKYNKKVLNASLFKLKEIGLVDEIGQISINGDLLMINSIVSDNDDSIVIEGYKYYGPISAYRYKVKLRIIDRQWKVINIEEVGVA
ncbi:hypothetical protein [Clostridium sp. LP20]|uniref:hypothetical protein n=1 Tax=Clostridium sp. LP20 TaxID=3418665 RepID=UPI003EE7C78E